MGRVQAMMVGAAVALAAAMPLAATGCGGGDGSDNAKASTPQGFKRTETPDFTLALPDAWTVDKGKQDTGSGEFIEARPPGSDVNRLQLRVASSHDYKSGIADAAQLAEGDVPAGGGIDAARIVTVLALSADRTLVNLSVGVAQSDVGSARIDDVVGSLKVGR
jgi:hypothetical protein